MNILAYWHGCRVEPVRNLVASDPCLTCRTARSSTTLALATVGSVHNFIRKCCACY